MKKVINVFITVFLALFCCLVMLVSLGGYLGETNSLDYSKHKLVEPVLKEASVKEIGKEYNGLSEDGKTFYLLEVKVDNPSSAGIKGGYLYLRYDSYVYGYLSGVETVESDINFNEWDNHYYLMPGKESSILQVISVDDTCKKFDVVYYNYENENEQRLVVEL